MSKKSKKGLMQQLFPVEGKTVPQLRFPEFRDKGKWVQGKIESICGNIFSGGTPASTNKQYYGGGIPFIRSGEIAATKATLFLTKEGLANSSAKMVKFGDVLVALYGANSGDVALGKIEGAINQAVLCLRTKGNNAFLFQYLTHRKQEITSKYLQGGQGNLSGDIIKSIEFFFPTKDEQQKIADCLSSIDDLITAQAQKIESLKDHKKGLMQQLFPAEGETVPKLRFPEFRDKGEWKEKKLCNLAKRITKKNRGNEVTRVLTNSAADGIVDQRDYFDKDIANKSNLDGYFIVDMYDYVYNPRVSNSAPVGPISKNKIARGVVSPLYTVFRFKNSKNVFYEHYFKSTCWHQYLRMVSNSGARHDRMSITIDAFEEMPLPDPLPDEQKKIADCLSSIDDLITAQAQKTESLKAHKKGLMQQLFPAEGETVPKLRFPEFLDAGEWGIKPLGESCDILNNLRKPITGSNREKGFYRYYGASGIVDYVKDYIFDEKLLLIGEDGAKWGAFEKTAFIVTGKYWVNNHVHVLRVKMVNDIFLENYIIMLDIAPFITGAAPPKLTLKNLKKIPIPVPQDKKEQQKIADCLSSIDDLITAQAKKIESLKDHKKGLMQQLFPVDN